MAGWASPAARLDIGAWAKELQEKIATQDVMLNPTGFTGTLPVGGTLSVAPDGFAERVAPQLEGPPAKVAKVSESSSSGAAARAAASAASPTAAPAAAPAEAPAEDPAAAPADAADAKAPAVAEEDSSEMAAGPATNIEAKKAHWAQVFATFQANGQSARAVHHAQALGGLRSSIKETFEKYKRLLADEDDLLKNAYNEALEEYQRQNPNATAEEEPVDQAALDQQNMENAMYHQQAIDLQVAAHQELESQSWQLRKSTDAAFQYASRTVGDFEEGRFGVDNPRPRKKKLPQRPTMLPCSFFMKTGDCAYGAGCKWDHPERGHNGPGCFHCMGPHLARECPNEEMWQRGGDGHKGEGKSRSR